MSRCGGSEPASDFLKHVHTHTHMNNNCWQLAHNIVSLHNPSFTVVAVGVSPFVWLVSYGGRQRRYAARLRLGVLEASLFVA